MKIKKGDHVMVMAGKDKGATGTVIAAYPDGEQGPRRGREHDQEEQEGDQPGMSAVPRKAAS